MKVKVLKRNVADYVRETKHDIHKVNRNYSSTEHPFQEEREYKRAMNAVKLERVFAKPLLGSLDGHKDGITVLAKHPAKISQVATAAADGELRIWDLSTRTCSGSWQGHDGVVRGLVYASGGDRMLSCADDKTIKTWDVEKLSDEPVDTVVCKYMVTGLSHSANGPEFATCGESTQLWSTGRSVPLKTFQWGVDSVTSLKFNPVETHLLAACASDRSILLYDTRDTGPVRKVVMNLNTNCVAWNPMEAMVFTAANEDYNLYAFDMRKLSRPLNVHSDHTGAVVTVDYSPTGREIVSGSYDKTIRIFPVDSGRSRDIYHTKRMQRLTAVAWSLDNRYIVSGSDEMCLRVWKGRAAEKLGIMRDRERVALQYNERLKEKYGNHPQVARIARHRHLPKHVLNAKEELNTIKESKKRKDANRRKHSRPGAVPYVPERESHTVEEME